MHHVGRIPGPLVPFTMNSQWHTNAAMHLDSDLDFQKTTWPRELSESDKKRLIANCEAKWKRTKTLAAVLETVLWISAIACWLGITYLCQLNP
jgi:hypothetical protein